ncbi:hypothetical protein VB773_15400 [Haloarculaceae archaeon H-GB2-1]|nr:hypothetical protein [Haloarculaceae archaeon H-GB2-1]
MSRLGRLLSVRTVAIVLAGLGVTVGGAFAAGVLGVPSVVAVENSFAGVSNETTTIETDLTVSNPNPVGGVSATPR